MLIQLLFSNKIPNPILEISAIMKLAISSRTVGTKAKIIRYHETHSQEVQ